MRDMKVPRRLWASAALLLASSPAMADPHGLLTLVVGVPLLIAASVVLGVLLLLPPSKAVRIISACLFVPAFLYSLYVALDALTLFNDIDSENAMIGFSFFGLFALACLLFGLILLRPLRPISR